MHGCRPVPLIAMVSLIIGCTWVPSKHLSAKPSFLCGNPPEVRERLLTHIPIGTPQKDAERLAELLGLERTPQSDLGFQAQDSIHCRFTVEKGLFGQAIWLIQIDCPDGKVADILCEQIGITHW